MLATAPPTDPPSLDAGDDERYYLEADAARTEDGRFAVAVMVVDSDGAVAALDVGLYDLTGAQARAWREHLTAELDFQRAEALDEFCRWLMDNGWSRNEAAAQRELVVNADALPALTHTTPVWECMSDHQRHQAICASLQIPDPLAGEHLRW